MIKKIKTWLKKYIDYKIVGEYYDTKDGIHYVKSIRKNIF